MYKLSRATNLYTSCHSDEHKARRCTDYVDYGSRMVVAHENAPLYIPKTSYGARRMLYAFPTYSEKSRCIYWYQK